MGKIDRLSGFLNEPYIQDWCLAVAKEMPGPFLLRELRSELGLPAHVVNRCLSRLAKKGELSRRKVPMSYAHFTKHGRTWRPGGRFRRVYLYSVTVA